MLALLKVFRRYFFRLSLMAASMLLLAAPFAWLQIHHPQQSHSLNLILSQYALLFTGFRWCSIIALIVAWPMLIHYFAQKQQWESEKTQFWLLQRYRIAGWLMVFEILFCEGWLLSLIKAI